MRILWDGTEVSCCVVFVLFNVISLLGPDVSFFFFVRGVCMTGLVWGRDWISWYGDAPGIDYL